MPTDSPNPLTFSAPRLLDISGTLHPTGTGQTTTDFNLRSDYAEPLPATPQWPVGIHLPPLGCLRLAADLARLYEMIFPQEPDWLTETVEHWHGEETVAAAVEQFLQRVSTFFPVHEEVWDIDLEAIAWRLEEIPLIVQGFDEWYEAWAEYKEPVPFLLHLIYSRESTFGRKATFTQTYPDHCLPQALQPFQLVECLRQMSLPAPLAALPDLLQMLAHETGNPWLDVGELTLSEGDGYPTWEAETVAWLTTEWQKAQPVLDRVDALLDWSNDSPERIAEKLTAVRQALLAAYDLQNKPELAIPDCPTETCREKERP
ncbi:MAG: hypothetical protein WAS33_16355 [Candidatus Promineifilaceae bacterium]